jgi:GTPase SAR1 family protein
MIEPNENLVVIVGPPAAGKTSVAEALAEKFPDYKVYHSDDYMIHGFTDSMYKLMEDIQADPNPKIIVEGIQAARLLRKGVQLGTLFADLVIEVDSPQKEIRYVGRSVPGTPDKPYPYGTMKSVETVLNEYKAMNKREPRIIKLTT